MSYLRRAFLGFAFGVGGMVLLSVPAQAQNSIIGTVIQGQSGGTPIGGAVGVNCSTNVTCSIVAGILQVSVSGSLFCAPVGSPTANAVLFDNGSGCPADATSAATIPAMTYLGTTATNSASLGPELTTSGTCSGTGWTGTYPNYVAPGTTNPLTCTGFTSGQFYQTVTSIGAGGSGSVVIAIGGAQTASGSSGTVTAGLKANGTSVTYTPASTYTGTIGISVKLITPISQFTVTGKDSTGAVSAQMLLQQTASLDNVYIGGGGSYNTTGNNNVASGYQALYSNTTGTGNVASGLQALYSNTTGYNNVASGYQALYSNTTGTNNVASGYQALYSNTTGNNNVASGYQALYSNTTGSDNVASGLSGPLFQYYE